MTAILTCIGMAQEQPVKGERNSSGALTTAWTKITGLGAGGTTYKSITIINTGTDTIFRTINAVDTLAASRSKWAIILPGLIDDKLKSVIGDSVFLKGNGVNGKYILNSAYRNSIQGQDGGQSVYSSNVVVTSLNTQNDTIHVHGTYYKEFIVTDSILCISAASHAAATIIGNSATASGVNWLKFLNIAASANGKIILTGMQINSDSLNVYSGVVILNNDTTKSAKIADNAQNVFASETFNYRVAEIPFSLQTLGVGTGSTGLWDCQYIPNWEATADANKNVYGKIVATSTAILKLNGYIRVKLKGWQEVIVP